MQIGIVSLPQNVQCGSTGTGYPHHYNKNLSTEIIWIRL